MDEDREKKLQAGKEKFAQLLKKKHQGHASQKNLKRQKKAEHSLSSSVNANHSASASSSLSSGNSEMESHQSYSESLSMGSIEDTRLYSERIDSSHHLRSSTFAMSQSHDCTMEHSVAMSDLHELSSIPQDPSLYKNDSSLQETELKGKVEGYAKKIQEFQNALAHRDVIIAQITASLQSTIKQRDALQAEANLQADSLVSEVNTLKLQLQQQNKDSALPFPTSRQQPNTISWEPSATHLQQKKKLPEDLDMCMINMNENTNFVPASEMLRTHKGKNGISAQELLDVKNQVISLEQMLHKRDDKITQMLHERTAISNEFAAAKLSLEETVQRLAEKLEKTAHEFSALEERHRDVCKSNEETKLLLRQKEHDLQLTKQQAQDVKDKSSQEVQDLMKQLEVLQQSQQTEPSAEQLMATLQAELDEAYGLQISQMKQQMSQQQEIQLKQIQARLDVCAQERDSMRTHIELLRNNNPVPKIDTVYKEASASAVTEKPEFEFVISKQKEELDRLNCLVQQHKQDTEKLKCYHTSEIRRVQKLHDEELKRKINDVESSRQTITSLRNNVKHLQNELQSLKSSETNVDLVREKATLEMQSELQQVKSEFITKLDSLLKEKDKLEAKVLSLSSELFSRKELQSKLIAAKQEIKLLKEEHETLVQEVNSSQKQSTPECLDWDIAINLGDFMKEMMEIKTENQKLKASLSNVIVSSMPQQVHCVERSTRSGPLPTSSTFDTLEGGDNNLSNNPDETHWQQKCDELLQEKLELEMRLQECDSSDKLLALERLANENKDLKNRLQQCSDLEVRVEKLVKERNELKNRILQLEDDVFNHQQVKTKCEALETEKSQLKEKYLNQINSLEKVKLDLELGVKELESKYVTAVKLKQDIEEEYHTYKQGNDDWKCLISPSDSDGLTGVENLIKQVMSLENSITVLKLRLQQEEELKNVLSAKMLHLMERCETFDTQRKEIKNELEALCSQLEVAWKQHEHAIGELADTRKELETNKTTYEKDLSTLRSELHLNLSELESLRIRVDEAYVLGSDEAKLSRAPESEFCTASVANQCGSGSIPKQFVHAAFGGNVLSEFPAETLEIKHKLELVLDSNRLLLAEKDALLVQLRSQDSFLNSLKEQMSKNELLSSEVQDNFEKQLGSLQIQQNHFLHQLCDYKEQQLKLVDVLEDKSLLQEAWRRETEELRTKFREKSKLETQLLQQKVQLERSRLEKHSLEEQLLNKDRLEQELMRQRRTLEEELIELEQRLRDREDVLLREKAQLQSELVKKDLTIRKWRTDFSEKQLEFDHISSCLLVKQNDQVKKIHVQLQEDGMSQIEHLRLEMDKHHATAIARLKQDLQEQFAVRESRLLERHSVEVLNLHTEHKRQLELLQSACRNKSSGGNMDSDLPSSDTEMPAVEEMEAEYQSEWSKLKVQLTIAEQNAIESLYAKIAKCKFHEMEIMKKQLKEESLLQLQEREENFFHIQKQEMLQIIAEAEHAKNKALAELRDGLTKSHKDELNTTVQLYETTINNLRAVHHEQLCGVLEIKTLSLQEVLKRVMAIAVQEYNASVEHLTQQWESEYLQRLADLRKELEEKFQEAVAAQKEGDVKFAEAPQDEQAANMKEERSTAMFEEVHQLLEQKEELIKKATGMRKTLEGVTILETNILKEHIQQEFKTVLEIQKDIKRDIETNKLPVLVELQKVKEDYQQLQEKYEEIVQERIEVKEYPIKTTVSNDPASGDNLQQVIKPVEEVKHLEVATHPGPEVKSVDLDIELKNLKEKLEKKHFEEMEQLRIYFEQRCESMERKYAEEVSRQRTCHSDDGDEDSKEYTLRDHGARPPTLTHFCDAYAMEPSFRDFEEHYKKEFDDKLQQYREQLETVRRDIESKHAAEIKTLQTQKEANIELEIENVRMELTEKYTKEIEDLLAGHEDEVENLRSKYAEDLAREVTKVRVDCTSELAGELETESKKIEEMLKGKHLKDLENLRSEITLQHQREQEILETRLNAQKSEDINQAILSLRDNLQQEREKDQNDLSISSQENLLDRMAEDTSANALLTAKTLEEMRKRVESEVKEEHEAKLLQLNTELSTVKEELEKLQASSEGENQYTQEIEVLKEKLMSTQEELDSLKQAEKVPSISDDLVSGVTQEDKDSLLLEAEKESRIAIEVLREQFQAEMKELLEENENKIKLLEEKWTQDLKKALLKQEGELEARHLQELEKLREQHKLELVEERSRLQDELTADHITKFEAVTHTLDSNHQMELEDLKQGLLKESEEAMEQLRHDLNMKEKEFKSLIQEMKESHEKDVEELQAARAKQLAAEVRRVKQEMESLNDEKLQAVALDTDVLKNELEGIHRAEIIEFQEKLSKKHQEELEQEVKKTIQEMENNFQATIAKLEDRHLKELECLRKDLEENFVAQLEMAREEFMKNKEAEIAELHSQFNEELHHAQQRAMESHVGLYSAISESELYQAKEEVQDEQTMKVAENVPKDDTMGERLETVNGEEIKSPTKSQDELDSSGSVEQHVGLLTSERDTLRGHNEHLQQVLSDLLKSYMTAETTINRQLAVIAGEDGSELSSPRKSEKDTEENTLETGPLEINTLSFLSEEGVDLDLSHRISEQMFAGSNLDSSAEEIIYNTGVNLQLAVKRLLHLLAVTVHQCHESKLAQLELVDDAAENAQKAATLISKCEELQVQLNEEIKSKDQLALELHKASELISAYGKEKSNLEAHLRKQEETQHSVVAQLEQQHSRNHELEERMAEEKNHLQHQRTIIAEGLGEHEQLSQSVTGVTTVHGLLTDDPGLLEENSRLYANHRDLQRQSEKDKQNLTARIHELEIALEEHITRSDEVLEERRREIDDLRQQVEALEKQLRANKQFIEEQTADREQEREDFQRQLLQVENIMKEKERLQGTEGRLAHEVETLAEQLQEKTLVHREAELKKLALEAELQSLIDKISDLKEIIKTLEAQLEVKTQTEQELAEQVKNLKDALDHTTEAHDELASELEVLRHASTSADLTSHIKFLEDQLESRSHELESLHVSQSLMQELRGQLQKIESKVEKKTRDLEALQLSVSSVSSPSSEELSLRDQLEAMRSMNSDYQDTSEGPMYFDDVRRLEEKIDALGRAEEAAIKKTRDLEMSLRKQKLLEEELVQDKEALQHQVNKQLLQISALQARIEERRHNLDTVEAAGTISNLQAVIERERELLENKEKECEDLRDQLEQTRQQLVIREDEVAQLMVTTKPNDKRQLGQAHDSKVMAQLKEENQRLQAEIETLQEHLSSASMNALTQTLLNDKNEEIDHLNAQLEELQTQLNVLQQTKQSETSREIQAISEKLPVADSFEKSKLAEELVSISAELQENSQGLDSVRALALEKDAVIDQLESDLKKAHELAGQRKREVESLRGVLKEKQALLIQVETFQSEVESLTNFQTRLQEDYDSVQTMLEETQKEIMIVQKQLLERDARYQWEQGKLENEVSELKVAVMAKDKDVHTLQERLDLMAQNGALKQDELRREIMRLRDQLERIQGDSIEVARRDSESSTLSTQANLTTTTATDLQDSLRTGDEERVLPYTEISDETLAIGELQEKLNIAITQVRETSDRLVKREQDLQELQKEKENLEFAVSVATNQGDHWKHESEEAATRARNYQTRAEVLEHQFEQMQNNYKLLAIQHENLQSSFKGNEASFHQANLELQSKLHSMSQAAISDKSIDEIRKQLKASEKQLHALQSELKAAQEQHLNQSLLINQLKGDLVMAKEDEEKTKAVLATAKEAKKMLEVKFVLGQSEIDRLCDELLQQQEEIANLQHSLLLEKENVKKLEHERVKADEKLAEQAAKHKVDLEQALSDQKGYSSDSGSATDVAKSLTLEVERTKQLDSNMIQYLNGHLLGTVESTDQSGTESEPDTTRSQPVSSELQALLNRVHKEGVEVLSLSELLLLRPKSRLQNENEPSATLDTLHQAWESEKRQLLVEIMALKELLTQATEATASLRSTGQVTTELNSVLLKAVGTVFKQERSTLIAELRTQILSNTSATPNEIQRLEQRIQEMDAHQRTVFKQLQQSLDSVKPGEQGSADAIQKERLKHCKEREKLIKHIAKLEDELAKREKYLKQQLEMLEYRAQQEKIIGEDLRTSLDMEKKRTCDLTGQLTEVKGNVSDLEMALATARTDILRLQSAAERDKQEVQNLKAACESEKLRAQVLLQALESEQGNFSQLQEALEAEKRCGKAKSDRQQQVVQELQRSLDLSKEKHVEVVTALEKERLALVATKADLSRLRQESGSFQRSGSADVINTFDDLNRKIDLKSALERERQRSASLTNTLMEERTKAAEELDSERSTCRQLKRKVDALMEDNDALRRDFVHEKERATRLESEASQLQLQVSNGREAEKQRLADWQTERQMEHEQHRETALQFEHDRQRKKDLELELQTRSQKINLLEKELTHLQEREKQLTEELEIARQAAVLPSSSLISSYLKQPEVTVIHNCHVVEAVKQQLQCRLLQFSQELDGLELKYREPSSDYIIELKEVIKSFMGDVSQASTNLMSNVDGNDSLSATQFVEQVLNQNAELVGFVSRLCEDKLDLRRIQSELEEELVRLRQKEVAADQASRRSTSSTSQTIATERVSWAQEKASLQLALHKVEAELARLRSELRSRALTYEHDATPSGTSNSRIDEKLHRLHLKYLRAESFRKALVYQKRYLLILLGGFQDTEAATLAAIARMGVSVSTAAEPHPRQMFIRFRSAVRVIIAVHRLKFLVRRWHHPMRPAFSPFGSHHDVRHAGTSISNGGPDENLVSTPRSRPPSAPSETHYRGIHRVGTTPPVRDIRSNNSSRATSERSGSTARRSLLRLPITSVAEPVERSAFPPENFDRTLRQYKERLESLQQQMVITSISTTVTDTHRNVESFS